jgi:hypothetical protein
MLVVSLPVLGLGCGSAAPDVDKAVAYTPESIAQELAFRYRALGPDAKTAAQQARPIKSRKSTAQLESDEKLQTKGKDLATPKKRSGPSTLDDVIQDVDAKLHLLQGVSRTDACQKIIEVISQDKTLTGSDKKLLTEKLKELAAAS